jgi:muramoyltetrapeptide carboxypeptidase LdcA involved in peptidoglycan recycling
VTGSGPGPLPIRPARLRPGDQVAVLSPSWGGPAAYPHVFDQGLAVLRGWGLEVRESPTTRARPERLFADPRARAEDLNRAFADPTIRAIFVSIGGDDSIRLLPHLDLAAIAANPKILMGYSDTTTILAAARVAGLVAFHGPSVMAGLSQMGDLPPAYRAHVRSMLFETAATHRYVPYGAFVDGYPAWSDPSLVGLASELQADDGAHLVQGAGTVTGELFGGCLEVLDWIRGTTAWPVGDAWQDRLLFVEPSEERPTPTQVERILRSFGALGVFDRIVGILVGRARDQSPGQKAALESTFRAVVGGEFGRPELPIVANLDFGHTDPQWVLPIGVRAELDVDARALRLIEPWLV